MASNDKAKARVIGSLPGSNSALVDRSLQDMQSNRPYDGPSILDQLPFELTTAIFNYLEVQDLSSIAQTCHTLARAVSQKIVWLSMLHKIHQNRPIPLPKRLFNYSEGHEDLALNPEALATTDLNKLREAALRATALEAKLSVNDDVEINPTKVELLVSVGLTIRWIYSIEGDRLIAVLTTTNLLTIWERNSQERIVEGLYREIYRRQWDSRAKAHHWRSSFDEEGYTYSINLVYDNHTPSRRDEMVGERIVFDASGMASSIASIQCPLSGRIRVSILKDEIMGSLFSASEALYILLLDWKIGSKVLICTTVKRASQRVRLTTSRDNVIFYNSSQLGGMAYTYTFAYFRSLLQQASNQDDPTATLFVTQGPQIAHRCRWGLGIPGLDMESVAVPRIRRMWTGQKCIIGYHRETALSPVFTALLPNSAEYDSITDHALSEQIYLNTLVPYASLYCRPDYNDYAEGRRQRYAMSNIGKGVKHHIWIRYCDEEVVKLSIATIPHKVDAEELPEPVADKPLRVAPVTLVWTHGNMLEGSWMDAATDLQFDDHYGYVFVGCKNGDIWKLSLV